MNKSIYKLDIDYRDIFKEWTHYLNILLTSTYMHNLMVFLNESYKSRMLYPQKKNVIFKPFQLVNFYKVRVVILGKEPYNDNVNTGIPFAQRDNIFVGFENATYQIEKTIEETQYNGFRLNIDTTLENWTNQGVLPLYAAMTVEKDKSGSNLLHWRNFTREIIKALSTNRTGIIYCLWGEEAQYFKQFINEDSNYILEASNPQNIKKINKWDCNHFKEINEIITENNGSDFCIKW